MKLAKFTNNYIRLFAQINKAVATSYKPVPTLSCSLYYQYQNLSNCLTMIKLFRHAQTQHGDDTVDLENIVLCKANIFTEVEDHVVQENRDEDKKCDNNEGCASDTDTVNLKSNDKTSETDTHMASESTQCVWFFEVKINNVGNVEKIQNC